MVGKLKIVKPEIRELNYLLRLHEEDLKPGKILHDHQR